MRETKEGLPITFGDPSFVGQYNGCDEWWLYVIEERATEKVIIDALLIKLPIGTVGTYNETLA